LTAISSNWLVVMPAFVLLESILSIDATTSPACRMALISAADLIRIVTYLPFPSMKMSIFRCGRSALT
jgi:hypothetical protein